MHQSISQILTAEAGSVILESLRPIARCIGEANGFLPVVGCIHHLKDKDIDPGFQFHTRDRGLVGVALPGSEIGQP